MTTTGTQASAIWGKLWIMLPMLLAIAIYLFTTTGRAVIDYDEGYYAQAAKHMVEHRDWVTPYANGVRFLEKPPFLYWVTAASFTVFGINEFALRFPTALAVIALVWIMMRMARNASGEPASLVAGFSTACCVGMFLFTRETLHDIWLVFFIALAMHGFLRWYLDPMHSLRPALLFYFAIAGAMLCKSLIGVAFPVGILAVFFLVSREWPEWRKLHILPGSLLFIALTAPWHWMAAIRNEGFLNFFFVGEQFLRFFSKREPPILWSVPLVAFWALVLVWFFPWTAFLPAAFMENRKAMDKRQRALIRLAISWAIVILGFFSLTDRLEHYAFPALPALSLLIAGALGKAEGSKPIRRAFGGLAVLGVLALVFGICAGIWIATGHGLQYSSSGPADRLSEADFSILADMPAPIVRSLLKPAAGTVLLIALGFAAAFRYERRLQRRHALICLAVVMTGIFGMIHWSFYICEDLISSKKFAHAVAQMARPGDRLVVVDDYESANSLNFYQPLRVEVYDGLAYALVPGMKYPDAPKVVLTRQEFATAWQSESRVFALVPKVRLAEIDPAGMEMLQILHRVLIRNR
ncbi:MAG: glycosyltransferase family 39 protein [Acidobacteria bacterium]|nr:glycosyltransferase family 39 protein [Acidobacteriota bacterium]